MSDFPTTQPNPLIARLAALCDGSGLSRAEIAGRAGMKPGDLSRLLSGRRDPNLSTIARVMLAIDAKWAELDGKGGATDGR